MDRNSQEAFAIQLIFKGQDALSVAMRSRIDSAIILSRKNTVVGFYSNIKLIPPLDAVCNIYDVWARNFSFNYPSLPYGGMFNCAFDSEDSVEIEGVTFGDDIKWPSDFDINLISEML